MSRTATYECLNKKIARKIIGILNHYNVKYVRRGNNINFMCPIHGSDSIDNASIVLSKGVWSCWSGNCCGTYGKSLVGLISGLEEAVSGRDIAHDDVVKIVRSINCEMEEIIFDEEEDYNSQVEEDSWFMDEENVPMLGSLSQHYLMRKFSPDALRHFDVRQGLKFPWNHRSFVLVKYKDSRLMGFSARSHFRECPKCQMYHKGSHECVERDDKYASFYKKWYHKPGSKFSKTLYGIDKIPDELNKITVVEGPSCVWKLWEHDIPTVACLGKFFSNFRMNLLLDKGVKKIMFVPDNDNAGKKFMETFLKKFSDKVDIVCPEIMKKDISDMTHSQINNSIEITWSKL